MVSSLLLAAARYPRRWCAGAAAAALILAAGCASRPPAPPTSAPAAEPRHQEWEDAIVYFVITDRFVDGDAANNVTVDRAAAGAFHGGDLRGLTDRLDEIADLGVTALWITPVVKNVDSFVTGAGFPDWAYHGYWADDFTHLDPRFGSTEELKTLVDACHRRGIAVLLDVVYNHAGYGTHYLTDAATRDWLRSNETGSCGADDVTSCVAGLPDFKTELPEVADYLLDAQIAHARQSGVDGFRLDTVKHVGHEFWQLHRQRTRQEIAQRFFLLGEVWGGDPDVLDPWFELDEMDAGFDFGFAGSTIGWVQGRGRTIAFSRYLEKRHRTRAGHILAHYLSSHDVPGALHQLGGDVTRFRLCTILQMTSVGIPVVYYGEEVARPGGEWPANRSDMPWGERDILPGHGLPRDEAVRKEYRRLIAIRRAHPALSRGGYAALSTDGDALVFAREDVASPDLVLVAVNRGEATAIEVERPAAWVGATVHDLWHDQVVSQGPDGKLRLVLDARDARILVAGNGAVHG